MRWIQAPRIAGMSLVEVAVTMAILGILTMIVITYFFGSVEYAKNEVGADSAALLNQAVNHYTQIAGAITVDAAAGGADELDVVEILQTRDTALPGSPYVPAEKSYDLSDDINAVRLNWSGKYFEILQIGEAGTGIVVAP